MGQLTVGELFPSASLRDIDDHPIEFPSVFETAPASIAFFYRGRF